MHIVPGGDIMLIYNAFRSAMCQNPWRQKIGMSQRKRKF